MAARPRVIGVSQARVESTRLPGKSLKDLAGRPLVYWAWSRMKRAASLDEVVIAIPDTSPNDVLEDAVRSFGAEVFRGSLDDVLDRHLGSALAYMADALVRVTSDCPFAEPAVIDDVVERLLADDRPDYASSNLLRTYPLGVDAEAFTIGALKRAACEATQDYEREHVTPYIYQHPDLFRLANIEAPDWARRPYRLTIDEPADFALAEQLYVRLDTNTFTLRDVIAALDADPALAAINEGVRNRDVERPSSW